MTTDGAGNVSFTLPLSAAFAPGEWVTATATDPAGNTSEFSAGVTTNAVTLVADPCDPSKTTLVVSGTSSDDTIEFNPSGFRHGRRSGDSQ